MSEGDRPPDADATPRTLGRYELLGELARGGQGVVHEACLPGVDGRLAIKTLLSTDSNDRRRFAQEAQVLARLQHPNLPKVVDLGEDRGHPYMVMELLAGKDLKDVLREQGTLDAAQSIEILATVARTLHFCHQNGIIHRDLKPGNVMIEAGTQRVVLIDFGLLKRDPQVFGNLSQDERATKLSQSGDIMGTPAYMAPEQIDPSFGAVSARTDVYALGATLYRCLTGETPFAGTAIYTLLLRVMKEPAPDPRGKRPETSRGLAELCLEAMAKLQEDRPASAEAFADALDACRAGKPSPAVVKPRPLAGRFFGALALLGVAVAFGLAAWSNRSSSPARPPGTQPTPTPSQTKPVNVEPVQVEPVVEAARPDGKVPPRFRLLRTEVFTAGGQEHKVEIYRNTAFATAIGLEGDETAPDCEFILVPGGTFTMGSPELESEQKGRERPQHEVRVEPFLLARTEITQRVWGALMGTPPVLKGAKRPVDRVSWDRAGEFCRESQVRLPSEAEWEYACRAGTTSPHAFDQLTQGANFGNANETTVDVGSYIPNAFGLFDMHGNLVEWCQDGFHENYRGAPQTGWPAWESEHRGFSNNSRRIRRGGSWNQGAELCRSARRSKLRQRVRHITSGLRPAASLR